MEVFAANGVTVMIQAGLGYTPTPVISHAILTANRGRSSGLADGVVITPSHNPPDDGGFKYNPPDGGPADTSTTKPSRIAPMPSCATACRRSSACRSKGRCKAETTHAYDTSRLTWQT